MLFAVLLMPFLFLSVLSVEIVKETDYYVIYEATELVVAERASTNSRFDGTVFSNPYNGTLPELGENFGDLILPAPEDATLFSADVIDEGGYADNIIIKYSKTAGLFGEIAGLRIVNRGNERGYTLWAGYSDSEAAADILVSAGKKVYIAVEIYSVPTPMSGESGVNLKNWLLTAVLVVYLFI